MEVPTKISTDHASNKPRMSRYRSVRLSQSTKAAEDVKDVKDVIEIEASPPIPSIPDETTPKGLDRKKSMSRYRARGNTQTKTYTPPLPSSFSPAKDSVHSNHTISDASINIHNTPSKLPSVPLSAISPSASYPVPYVSPQHQQPGTYPTYQPTEEFLQYQQPNVTDAHSLYYAPPRPRAESTATDAARALLDHEAQRQARMRQAQELEWEERRRKDEEKRKKEEEKRRLEEEEKRLNQEADNRERLRIIQEKEEVSRRETEERLRIKNQKERERQAAKKAAEEKKADEELWARMHRQKSRSVSTVEPESPQTKEKARFFSYWKTDKRSTPNGPPTSVGPVPTLGGERINDEKPTIKPGGGGIVPGIDAPVSAVNHGDRRVRIVSRGKSVLLPVNTTTTPLQLIRSSVTFFDFPIDARNSLLFESYTNKGLQRPLRMYEHVRDILNSWTSDDQHELLLEPYDSSTDNRLYASSAPKMKPSGGSWWLYFSQKPGKWDKRFVSLTTEGQIATSKNESGKDLTNICHISDFEPFSLSKDGHKKVRPPKKFCYAIKSMQKSSMFLDSVGFIHLFSSADESVAQEFNEAVFRWRTWYLINVMDVLSNTKDVSTTNGTGHKQAGGIAQNYVLGSFNTSLDFDPSSFSMLGETGAPHHRSTHGLTRGPSIRRPLATDQTTRRPSTDAEHSSTTNANTNTGIIGASVNANNAIFGGIKPLVDLTPQYQAPPQHQRKGRGYKPNALTGALVEAATGPEVLPGAIVVPEARNWRVGGGGGGGGGIENSSGLINGGSGLGRSLTVKSSRNTSGPTQPGAASTGRGLLGDLEMNKGFTGGGLLAKMDSTPPKQQVGNND